MASPEILTRRVFLEKIEGYSNLAPELSHTVVPSVSVMLMRSPLGTNTLSELLEALRSNIFVAAK